MANIAPLFTWRSAIADSQLPAATRHVALALSLYMNERGGSAHPGPTLLAHDTGLHLSTVKAKLAELERTGWLVCRERGGIKGVRKCANVYEARVPVVSADPSSTATRRPAHPVPQTTRRPDRAHPSSSAQPPVVLDDPNSPENSPENSLAPATRPRKRDDLFEAVCRATGVDWRELNGQSRGPLNKAVGAIRESSGTPTEVFRRAGEFKRKYPNAALTPNALAKHWAALGNGAPQANSTLEEDLEAWKDLA